MKKQMIAAAIAAAVAAPAAMAGAPTVYGQINMSVDSLDTSSTKSGVDTTDKAASGVKVSSNASRIGVKGSSDLGNGLKAIYKIEFGVDVDDASKVKVADGDNPDNSAKSHKLSAAFSARNAYVGLAGGFGAVLLGRHDTPMKMSQPTDTFNDGYGDLRWMAGGLGVNGGEVRASNVLAYVSPSFNGIKFVGAVVPNEGGYDTNGDTVIDKSSGLTDIYSLALMYGSKKKGLYLSAAYNNWDKYTTMIGVAPVNKSLAEYRLSAQYSMGALMANVMYQNFDVSGTSGTASLSGEGSNWQTNLAYTLGAATLKAKYSSVDYSNPSQKDGSAYGLGVDYALGKKTTAYVEYVASDKFNLFNTNGGLNRGDRKANSSAVSIGLLHKF